MKNILLLGAGLVAKPLVDYLLSFEDIQLTIASRSGDKGLLSGKERGVSRKWNVEDRAELQKLVDSNDLVISLLPADYHPIVAECALKSSKHMMSTSYLSPKMRSFDEEARSKGLLFLNECGVDPGMDHMSAMKIINAEKSSGNKIKTFISFCGGLPAPSSCDNPLNYKFSWSPRGVLVAATSPAKYLKKGKVVEIDGMTLFENCESVEVGDVGVFDGYPNRDSTIYREIYGLDDIETLLRGTLRFPEHCELFKRMVKIGLFSKEKMDFSNDPTYSGMLAKLISNSKKENLAEHLSKYMQTEENGDIMKKLKWLGLFSDEPLPLKNAAPIDLMTELMKTKMNFKHGEVDMIVMKHRFEIECSDKRTKEITSHFVYYGTPNGDSAMSKTVSLPVAIAARLFLDGKINLTGVRIPVVPELYLPILEELANLGMSFREDEKYI
ncbi:saccharopine dehydrogenase NADP-binding domain-containing protein [candidate division WOR-3 bacterium]|nr:saccharopine dehydrogenase NADP-binding domain-containing protein [candidate division WOR-3 bacterium]